MLDFGKEIGEEYGNKCFSTANCFSASKNKNHFKLTVTLRRRRLPGYLSLSSLPCCQHPLAGGRFLRQGTYSATPVPSRAHSLHWCSFLVLHVYGFGLMCIDKCHHHSVLQSICPALKILCVPPIHPFTSQPLATTDQFTVSIL